MPAVVTRQWHLLRAACFAARGARPHLGPRPRPAGTVQLCAYATKKGEEEYDPVVPNAIHGGIIVPSSVANTQPKDIIAHIEPAGYENREDRVAIFFITPAFATWLLDDQVFLKPALEKIYKPLLAQLPTPNYKIRALAAVVDKLPTPHAIDTAECVQEAALRRALDPPVSDGGHEGVAWTLLRVNDIFTKFEDYEPERKGVLEFIVSRGKDTIGNGFYEDLVQLPLANTIFQTGSTTTLKFSHWQKADESGSLRLESVQDWKRRIIQLQRRHQRNMSALSVPLVPLTYPRQIEQSMGNILRRLSGEDGKIVAASQELESIVPQYFGARGESPRPVSVWALLIPKQLSNDVAVQTHRLLQDDVEHSTSAGKSHLTQGWHNFWARKPPHWNDLVPAAIARGARLCRVLSGGGGWGKKAGLLSLDPSFYTTEQASTGSEIFDLDALREPEDFSSAIHEIMQPGDSVQFFACPYVSEATSTQDTIAQTLERLSDPDSPTWTWELGMIPSTIDSPQNSSWQHRDSESGKTFVLRNSFGALSEGGLILKRHFRAGDKGKWAVTGGTNVDVPNARFCSLNMSTQSPRITQDDSINKSQAPRLHRGDDVLCRGSLDALPSTSSAQRQSQKCESQSSIHLDSSQDPISAVTPGRGAKGSRNDARKSAQEHFAVRRFPSTLYGIPHFTQKSARSIYRIRRLHEQVDVLLQAIINRHTVTIRRLDAHFKELTKQIRKIAIKPAVNARRNTDDVRSSNTENKQPAVRRAFSLSKLMKKRRRGVVRKRKVLIKRREALARWREMKRKQDEKREVLGNVSVWLKGF